MIVEMELREAGFTHVASLHYSVVNGRASRLAGASRGEADPLWTHPCRQEPAISPVAVQPRNNVMRYTSMRYTPERYTPMRCR
jgi:hypothetical protein